MTEERKQIQIHAYWTVEPGQQEIKQMHAYWVEEPGKSPQLGDWWVSDLSDGNKIIMANTLTHEKKNLKDACYKGMVFSISRYEFECGPTKCDYVCSYCSKPTSHWSRLCKECLHFR